MKLILLPILMFAAALTAQAHCGACGTGDSHAEKKACPADCSKPCCAKSEKKACASGCEKSCCAKSDKKSCCSDSDKKSCCAKPEKKACADGCEKACCAKPAAAAAPLMPCCAAEAKEKS